MRNVSTRVPNGATSKYGVIEAQRKCRKRADRHGVLSSTSPMTASSQLWVNDFAIDLQLVATYKQLRSNFEAVTKLAVCPKGNSRHDGECNDKRRDTESMYADW